MTIDTTTSPEAVALERIVRAAREVQVASTALENYFGNSPGAQPSTLELARFAAAMQELRDAREQFDRLLSLAQRQ